MEKKTEVRLYNSWADGIQKARAMDRVPYRATAALVNQSHMQKDWGGGSSSHRRSEIRSPRGTCFRGFFSIHLTSNLGERHLFARFDDVAVQHHYHHEMAFHDVFMENLQRLYSIAFMYSLLP